MHIKLQITVIFNWIMSNNILLENTIKIYCFKKENGLLTSLLQL